MKHQNRIACALLAWSISAAAEEVVIQSFDQPGQITFSTVTNGAMYRVEWATSVGGTWTSFSAAASSLDTIVPSGPGVITASVPMVYRVVATVPPPGMALIPAGTFVMGATTNVGHESTANELPQHPVYVSAFFMDKHETSKSFYDEVKAYADTNGYIFSFGGVGKATNHPVQTVTWFDAARWCNARSERDGLTPVYYTNAGMTAIFKTGTYEPFADWSANGYRLPTEAEWEKAARGGVADRRFPWSDSDDIQHARANYLSNTNFYTYDTSPTPNYHPAFSNAPLPYTSPVGSFAPNDYGLHDMAGNVWEWCWDWYGSSYYGSSPATDPRGPDGPLSFRVARGGSWDSLAYIVRVALRNNVDPFTTFDTFGFRCVRGL